jgi:hypothetical protein
MSTPLQRLVERARGAQNSHALRIEPVPGPRFAEAATSGVTLQESDTEVIAPPRSLAGNMHAAGDSGVPPTPEVRRTMPDPMGAGTAPPLKDASPTASPLPRAPPGDDSHGARPARSLLDRAVDETSHEDRDDAPVRQPGTGTSPVTATPRYDTERIPAAPAQQAKIAMAQDESPPSITISIGHVEVRTAPAPAAPRRPAFRPGVSLDAFLQRGKGDPR